MKISELIDRLQDALEDGPGDVEVQIAARDDNGHYGFFNVSGVDECKTYILIEYDQ